MTSFTQKQQYHRRGQGLVEFALVLPVLMMLAFAIIDFAQVAFTYAQAQNSLREAVRLADVFGYATDPVYLNCPLVEQTAENIMIGEADANVKFIKARVHAKSPAPGNWAIMDEIVCGTTYSTNANIKNGDIMEIELDATVNFLTPFLSNTFPSLDMHFEARRTIVKDIQLGDNSGNDLDGDGMNDCWEETEFGTPPIDCADEDKDIIFVVDPFADPDNDGCVNACEESNGTDPQIGDHDDDGLKDGDEIYVYETDPTDPDSDEDGMLDGEEIDYEPNLSIYPDDLNLGPLDPTNPDTDGDGSPDGEEIYTASSQPVDPKYNDYRAVDNYTSDPWRDDSDGDGRTDGEELFNIPVPTHPRGEDTDNDGLSDDEEADLGTDPHDRDHDDDRILDGLEFHGFSVEVNGVMTPVKTNPKDDDTDDDGIFDGDEILAPDLDDPLQTPKTTLACNTQSYDSNPAAGATDSDSDGIDDYSEVCGFTMSLKKGAATASNHTIRTDPMKTDHDGDELSDGAERDGTFSPDTGIIYKTDPSSEDTDGGLVFDNIEILENGTDPDNPLDDPDGSFTDLDGDGVDDAWETGTGYRQRGNASIYDEDQHADADGDLCPNICESRQGGDPFNHHSDGDGLTDGQEWLYSTIASERPIISIDDTDADGVLNDYQEVMGVAMPSGHPAASYTSFPTKLHSDGDGLTDVDELMTHFTNPKMPDTDGDGLMDNAEVAGYSRQIMGVNTTVYPIPYLLDSDGDGLTDKQEVDGVSVNSTNNTAAFVYTDPREADTDGDGINDGLEVNGFDLAITVNGVSTNVTIRIDPTKADTDGDGLNDGAEKNGVTVQTSPTTTAVTNPMLVDTDNDTLSDGSEVNGVQVAFTDGTNPTLYSDPTKTDSDGDQLADAAEVSGTVIGGVTYRSNPLKVHTDADNLNDYQELNGVTVNIGTSRSAFEAWFEGGTPNGSVVFKSDPVKVDSDGDGLNDNLEVNGVTVTNGNGVFYSNPLSANSDGSYTEGGMSDTLNDYAELYAHQADAQYARKQTDPLMINTDGDHASDSGELAAVPPTLPNNVVNLSIADNLNCVKEPGGNNTTPATFTVTLTLTGSATTNPETVTVNFATLGTGTATLNTDYRNGNANTTLTFPANTTTLTRTFDMSVMAGGGNQEPAEWYDVILQNNINARILDGNAVGWIKETNNQPCPL